MVVTFFRMVWYIAQSFHHFQRTADRSGPNLFNIMFAWVSVKGVGTIPVTEKY